MSEYEQDTHEFPVTVRIVTEKAILCQFPDDAGKSMEHWIPRSQLREGTELDLATWTSEHNVEGTIVISDWMAKQKGLL